MKRPAPVVVAVRLRLPPIAAATEAELLRKVGEMWKRTEPKKPALAGFHFFVGGKHG